MKLADSALRAGYRINTFATLHSTSDEALRRAVQGDRGRLWIVAAAQSAGRGRQGRHWASPVGNVYASVLLVDAAQPAVASQLGFVAAVAAVRAVQPFLRETCRLAIKWPNDLLADGRKLAGILVEGSRLPTGRFACVLGFGINRASHPEGTPYPVTDLFALCDTRPSLDTVVEALTAAFHDALDLWDAGRGFPAIRRRWLDHALPQGTALSAAARTGRVEGRFETIDDDGRLVLDSAQGRISIEAGDVFLMEQPDDASAPTKVM